MQLHEISLHDIKDLESFSEIYQYADKFGYTCRISHDRRSLRLTGNDLWQFTATLTRAFDEMNFARRYLITGGYNENRIYIQAISRHDIGWWDWI